jgi:hypothetical protein
LVDRIAELRARHVHGATKRSPPVGRRVPGTGAAEPRGEHPPFASRLGAEVVGAREALQRQRIGGAVGALTTSGGFAGGCEPVIGCGWVLAPFASDISLGGTECDISLGADAFKRARRARRSRPAAWPPRSCGVALRGADRGARQSAWASFLVGEPATGMEAPLGRRRRTLSTMKLSWRLRLRQPGRVVRVVARIDSGKVEKNIYVIGCFCGSDRNDKSV